MAQSEKWPAYGVGPEKHLHALGVIAVNYNRLEMALDRLLYMYLGASREPFCYVFRSLNMNSQTALFNLCVNREEKDPALRDGLLYFCACFLICAENRNTLMHSNVNEEKSTDEIIAMAKAPKSKPHTTKEMQFDLKELRTVADEMWALFAYSAELFRFILARGRGDGFPQPALPSKPGKPMNLADRFQPDRKKP